MKLSRLQKSDGSWESFESDWKAQCKELGEELDHFSPSSLTEIERLASKEYKEEWAVGLQSDGKVMAVAMAIRATQSGYKGKVLRIREVTVCPLLDYGKLAQSHYIEFMMGLLNEVVGLSEKHLRAKHIKMHLRSPADATYFSAVGNTLDSKDVFEEVKTHGSWLSITKHSPIKTV